ncbi:hypothetical protein OSG_eHP32_00050 [environmental Halophage eHP-32]|nr:hypothetical protein OSG_eHP32_00050 [environmental Halophage eHP-32]
MPRRSFTARLRDRVASLAEALPQARDEEPIAISREEHTQEPDKSDIQRYVDEYYQNPLIRQPIRNFASDVVEPGVRINVGGDDEPTVPNDYKFAEFRGMDLSDALRKWLGQCAIVGGRFDRDVSDLLEDVVIDLRGRRGTALVEHAYEDPNERDYILGLRTFKVETTTAYTRDGKSILLRPDDTDVDFESVAVQDISGDPTRFDKAPTTPAGAAAALVQFDDIFGSYDEKDDIPFALDDVTIISNDPDTGAIFGRPDSASIVERSEELREMFQDTTQAIKAVGYGHWVANVDTNDREEARKLLDGFDPSDPERVNVTNYAVETEQFDSDVPDNVDHIQQQIEYILTALPTPLYRVGFAGDINRDISDVQQDDYREEVARERDRLESAFHGLLHQKAREFMLGSAKADDDLDVDVSLVIEPEESESPLEDENFDAGEFSNIMSGLKQAAPGGAVEQVVPPHEVRETFLGLSAEMPDAPGSDPDEMMSLPDETDPQVQETFSEAYLARQYSEGDVVQSPQGLGVVTAVETEPFTGKNGEEIDASDSSPTYIVGLKDQRVGVGFYSASELDSTEMPDTGVDDPVGELETEANSGTAELAETTFGIPDSWEESPKPNRLILLDAWSSMGGSFDGARRELGSPRLAASMKDRVLQWEGWREGGD